MHHRLKSVQEKDPQQVRLFVVSAVLSATFVFLHSFDVCTIVCRCFQYIIQTFGA